MLLSAPVGAETPKRQHWSKLFGILIFGRVSVIFVVIKLFFVSVLYDHSLHDLKCSFHCYTVERIFYCDLDLLLRLFVFFILHHLLMFIALDFLIGGHIGIENLPLSCFQREGRNFRRISLETLLSEWQIECLWRAFLEVKLVAEWFLLSFVISLDYNLNLKLRNLRGSFPNSSLMAMFILSRRLLFPFFLFSQYSSWSRASSLSLRTTSPSN